ncbi:hypothetical protein SESBI_40779 [Sesbania bispinosa]|nr:hypothetical protein SESBI_40779 [Sesbania bispinosa]
MTRRCSHCSHNGHNSRTCPNRGVKLFGVRLTDGSIRKSASMGNLTHYAGSGSGPLHAGSNNPGSPGETPDHAAAADGYASEDFVPGSSSSSRERKKGVPWTEEEHRMFYLDCRSWVKVIGVELQGTMLYQGLQLKWPVMLRNISSGKAMCLGGKDGPACLILLQMKFASDTPMVQQDFLSANQLPAETEGNNPLPSPPPLDEECESMDSTNSNDGEPAPLKPDDNNTQPSYPVLYPAYYSPFFPFPLPYWSGYSPEPTKKEETHEVLKPTAVHSKSPINVDELVGMSKLSLGDSIGDSGPSSLSRKLIEEGPSRQSAFHATPACDSSNMNGSIIHAV